MLCCIDPADCDSSLENFPFTYVAELGAINSIYA